jgi:hypothetical protein
VCLSFTWIEAFRLLVFMCIVRGHRVRSEFEVSCTGDVKRGEGSLALR